jgi:hypothetical protein
MIVLNHFTMAQSNTFPASGNVGIGTITPHSSLDVITPINGFSSFGSTYSPGQFSGLHFGYRENNTLYRKSALVFERTDNHNQGGNASGKIHFLLRNDGGYSATGLEDAIMTLNSDPYATRGSARVGIGTTTPSTSLELFSTDNTGTRINPHDVLTITAENNNYPYSGFGGGIVFKNRTYTAGILTGARMRSVINYDGYIGQEFGTSLAFDVTPTLNSGLTEAIRIKYDGNIGVGTTNPTEKLSVNGNIRAKKLIISQTSWSDYVFHKNYKLRPLSEVENYIKANQHLPEVPSAKEVAAKGISVGDTQALLLKKIEELTLYVIEFNKENKSLKNEIKLLKYQIKQLQNK